MLRVQRALSEGPMSQEHGDWQPTPRMALRYRDKASQAPELPHDRA